MKANTPARRRKAVRATLAALAGEQDEEKRKAIRASLEGAPGGKEALAEVDAALEAQAKQAAEDEAQKRAQEAAEAKATEERAKVREVVDAMKSEGSKPPAIVFLTRLAEVMEEDDAAEEDPRQQQRLRQAARRVRMAGAILSE